MSLSTDERTAGRMIRGAMRERNVYLIRNATRHHLAQHAKDRHEDILSYALNASDAEVRRDAHEWLATSRV